MQRRASRRWVVEGTLRPIGALAALHLLELRHQLAPGLGDVGGHGLALRLQAEAGPPLAVRGNAQVTDEAERGRNHLQSLVAGVSLCQTTVWVCKMLDEPGR